MVNEAFRTVSALNMFEHKNHNALFGWSLVIAVLPAFLLTFILILPEMSTEDGVLIFLLVALVSALGSWAIRGVLKAPITQLTIEGPYAVIRQRFLSFRTKTYSFPLKTCEFLKLRRPMIQKGIATTTCF